MDLRLLFTENCNRSCPGCVNNQWDLEAVKKIRLQDNVQFLNENFNKIILTDGEPLLYIDELITTLRFLKNYTEPRVIVYSAWNGDVDLFRSVFPLIDGLTYTVHEPEDIDHFLDVAFIYHQKFQDRNLSLRINIFGCSKEELPDYNTGEGLDDMYRHWMIKDQIEWIEDCPLPENEIFLKMV